MYVAVVLNRARCRLSQLRESYREAGKTKNGPANLSRWPAERIEQLYCTATNCCPPLRWKCPRAARPRARRARHRPHRARRRAAVPRAATAADLALALIVARLMAAKLATARDPPPPAIRWRDAGARRRRRQRGLCRARLAGPRAAVYRRSLARHLQDGALLLYDVTHSRRTLLRTGAAWLQSRYRGDRPQIVIGLMAAEGCPVVVEVFEQHR